MGMQLTTMIGNFEHCCGSNCLTPRKRYIVATSPAASSEPARPDSEVDAGISPHPRPGGARGDGSPAAASADTSSKGDDAGRGRSMLVNKVVEGLRGDAFLIARDLGLDTLTQEGGLEQLVIQESRIMFSPELKRKPRSSSEQARRQEVSFRDSLKSPC